MSCTPDVTDEHVREALRLFRVSTLDAASTGLDIDGSTVSDPDFIAKVRFMCCIRYRFSALPADFVTPGAAGDGCREVDPWAHGCWLLHSRARSYGSVCPPGVMLLLLLLLLLLRCASLRTLTCR